MLEHENKALEALAGFDPLLEALSPEARTAAKHNLLAYLRLMMRVGDRLAREESERAVDSATAPTYRDPEASQQSI